MTLAELVARYRPESWHGTRGRTWPEHAAYLWWDDPGHLLGLIHHMSRVGWFGTVDVQDDTVQDSHHRIVAAWILGWLNLDVPVRVLKPPLTWRNSQ